MSVTSYNDGLDRAAELANEIFMQVTSLLEEVAGCSMNAVSCEDADLSKLAIRRLISIRQLQEILTNTPLSDPLHQPVETHISAPQFLDELSQERKELRAALQNVEANKENLSTLLENGQKRDDNLLEIIEGLKKETYAIEDEDPLMELRNLEKMKKHMLRAFNAILDVAYPARKDDVKDILQELAQWDSPDPFMPVPENVPLPAVLLLAQAKIIELSDDFRKIKLLVPHKN